MESANVIVLVSSLLALILFVDLFILHKLTVPALTDVCHIIT